MDSSTIKVVLFCVGPLLLITPVHLKQQGLKVEQNEFSTPSIHWIQYQRERFSANSNYDSRTFGFSSDSNISNSVNRVDSSTMAKDFNNYTILNDSSNVNNKTFIKTGQLKDTKEKNRNISEIYVEADQNADFPDENPIQRASRLELPSIRGFFSFLKSLQKTWIGNSQYGIQEKIDMLNKLKNNLMTTIENRFALLLRAVTAKRRKRGILDESNLNFPSEAALMSINFLTFAVFLIKLVLQVVHIIKSKHYSFSGFGVNANTMTKTGMRN